MCRRFFSLKLAGIGDQREEVAFASIDRPIFEEILLKLGLPLEISSRLLMIVLRSDKAVTMRKTRAMHKMYSSVPALGLFNNRERDLQTIFDTYELIQRKFFEAVPVLVSFCGQGSQSTKSEDSSR